MEDEILGGAIPGVVMFLLSTTFLQRQLPKENVLENKEHTICDNKNNKKFRLINHWVESICAAVVNSSRYSQSDSGITLDNDLSGYNSVTSESTEQQPGQTFSSEARLHEMQRIFGYQKQEFCSHSISRVNSNRYETKIIRLLVQSKIKPNLLCEVNANRTS